MANTVRDVLDRGAANAPTDVWEATLAGLGDTVLAQRAETCGGALIVALVKSAHITRVRGCASRADALPLLALDAQVTHAFELWAQEDPANLEGYACDFIAAVTAGQKKS